MIKDKSITIASLAWGNHVQPTLTAISHCINAFPHFDQAIIFTNFALTLQINGHQLEFRNIGLSDLLEYNRFMVESLNEHITTDYVLIIQSDGFITHPHLWKDEFLDYDYLGAPWSCYGVAGNGGFCLRSKKFLEASALLKYDKRHDVYDLCPEDVFLCLEQFNRRFLLEKGIRFADLKTALDFSYESPVAAFPEHNITQSFGFHGKFNLQPA